MNRHARRAAQKHGGGPVNPPAPGGPVAHLFSTAVGHFYAGRLPEAEQACRDALAFDPDHFDSLHLLGVIAYRAGHPDVAADILGAALARNDASAECHNNLGLALAGAGRIDQAAPHFGRAVALDPDFVPARIGLGNALKALGRLDEAAAEYRRVLASNPGLAMAHYNLANLLREQERLGEAQEHYRRALDLEPQSAEILSKLAHTLYRQDRLDEALATYQRALPLGPHDADIHNNLGIVLKKQGRPREALGCFEEVLAIDPGHAGAQVNLCSTVYELSLSEPDAAREMAAQFMQTFGDKPLVCRGLAGLLGTEAERRHDRDYSRTLFDHFAGVFDKTLVELRYLDMVGAVAQALEISATSAPAWDVLDAGCGTGLCGPYVRPAARSLAGVDLSARMLDKARSLSVYDRLVCGDAIEFMAQNVAAFDLIVSSDVLTYIGDAADFARAAHRALRAGGRIAVSTEKLDEDGGQRDFKLAPSGRYLHARPYLQKTFAEAGFDVREIIESVMRMEAGRPSPAWIVVATKPIAA
jgi:predicted TPR repeat methyltransferase